MKIDSHARAGLVTALRERSLMNASLPEMFPKAEAARIRLPAGVRPQPGPGWPRCGDAPRGFAVSSPGEAGACKGAQTPV